ncbi:MULTISPECIES: CobW family GTP-binding protein [Pseudomonas]|uniref:CobW family GTP-binding protein n=1 Tax=Pseudomonas TaxID=286 RepID=UPI000406405B|nr:MULTISPECIES: CobW family GTP-binding protein [Pseudomonas]MBH3393144.1 GTP-binding protein [Pseudomonas monteilii]SNB50982.1 GTPase, G3E family [Pseudomonas sp. URIL14HWK12:I8]
MLQNIPTHVIAGPLGAGKTTLIRHLLAQRPAHERWAVLINEFGLVGLDAALLSRDEDGIAIGEVAGGCLCCVNGMPFQVGLGRLLRKSRPDRLFIEPSGLGHPLQLLAQLQQAPWAGVLTIKPFLMVVDAQSMARDEPLPEAQQQAFDVSESVVFNKSEVVDEKCKLLITNKFKDKKIIWAVQGKVPFSSLPGSPEQIVDSPFEEDRIVDNLESSPGILWTDPGQPICLAQQGEGGWSIGWRWHPGQQFYPQRVQAFLRAWPWRRAKGVIHSVDGWQSFNGLRGDMPAWQPSDWRRDSRIELIFDQPQSQPALQAGLSECRVS